MSTDSDYEKYLLSFNSFIKEQKLTAFYSPDSPHIQNLARNSTAQFAALGEYFVSTEIREQLLHLQLYKLVVFLDDSSSMSGNGGKSIASLRTFLQKVLKISSVYLDEGLSIRWLNSSLQHDRIKHGHDLNGIINRNPFRGWTRIGQTLRSKILDPLVMEPAIRGSMEKPVMVMMITDGSPAGEPQDTLKQTIMASQRALNTQTKYGQTAVKYQIAHVGNNAGAINFLRSLKNDPQLGGLVNCISEQGIEQAESLERSGEELCSELWVAQLMVGPIVEFFTHH